ncbi:hypothetical protein AOLI_G00120960 [Acnodon oligacanthus]
MKRNACVDSVVTDVQVLVCPSCGLLLRVLTGGGLWSSTLRLLLQGLSPPALLSAFDHGEALCFSVQADDNTSPAPAWNPSCPDQVTAALPRTPPPPLFSPLYPACSVPQVCRRKCPALGLVLLANLKRLQTLLSIILM